MKTNNWIFLRGLSRGNIHWGDFSKIFSLSYPEARTEYLEVPGNGTLYNEVTPTDPLAVINYLRNKSQIVRSGEEFNLVGISLGGMIALKWAELFPNEIHSLSVINSSLSQYSPFYHRLMLINFPDLIKALLERNELNQEKAILKITSNQFVDNQKYLDPFSEFAKTHKIQRSNFFRQLLLASNIKVDQIKVRNFKVYSSANDRLVHPLCSKQIASGLKGNIVIHPTAGHDLPLDVPQWLIHQLKENIT